MKLHVYSAIKKYAGLSPVRMHMPGHKGKGEVGRFLTPALDVTELSVIGNENAVKKAEKDCAALLGADNCRFSTDGATSCILTAISGVMKNAEKDGKLLILRSSHKSVYNALKICKVWSKEEIERIGALCNKYNVTVISDEIHCDLLKPGVKYIPFASVNDVNANITITTIAPTKTFNLAGLQTSAIVIKNKELMHLVDRGLNTDECAEPNTFALLAPKVVFNECDEWLTELNIYIVW